MNFGIIVAAGKSERMGTDTDKVFLYLGARPLLDYSIRAFEECPDIDGVILVLRKERIQVGMGMVKVFGHGKVKKIVVGGSKRQTSVQNGLAALRDTDVNIVVVHDGARPCVTPGLISETVKSAKRHGSGVAAIPVTDSIKRVGAGMYVEKSVDRAKLWATQTPQAFKRELLERAFKAVARRRLTVTDEAAAVELTGERVRLVPSAPSNIKVTAAEDLALAAKILKV